MFLYMYMHIWVFTVQHTHTLTNPLWCSDCVMGNIPFPSAICRAFLLDKSILPPSQLFE